jgi:hypothetical protein
VALVKGILIGLGTKPVKENLDEPGRGEKQGYICPRSLGDATNVGVLLDRDSRGRLRAAKNGS